MKSRSSVLSHISAASHHSSYMSGEYWSELEINWFRKLNCFVLPLYRYLKIALLWSHKIVPTCIRILKFSLISMKKIFSKICKNSSTHEERSKLRWWIFLFFSQSFSCLIVWISIPWGTVPEQYCISFLYNSAHDFVVIFYNV